jgi:hypothetical protein
MQCPHDHANHEVRSTTARAPARVLLKPRSHTTAFGGTTAGDYELPLGCRNPLPLVAHHRRGYRYFHMTDLVMHRIAKSGGRSASCVSVGLRL